MINPNKKQQQHQQCCRYFLVRLLYTPEYIQDMDKTVADKWELLSALYRHGTDVEALEKALPNWSTSQLKAIIYRFRQRARKKLLDDEERDVRQKPPLEQWIDLTAKLHQLQGTSNQQKRHRGRKCLNELPKDHAPLMSKVMMYAACFEEHYQGPEPDAPNYSEIYRYLAQLLEGKEPTMLSPGSAAMVLQVMGRIKKVVTKEGAHNRMRYFKKLPISYISSRVSQKNLEPAPEEPDNTSSGANPGTSECPLFQDAEEAVEAMNLEPGDPYYEVKKEMIMKKLEIIQQESASSLQFVPGLNPMELPTKLMVKPSHTSSPS
ncbi:hypothetical protein OTU49_011558 [Cherax quadricarinatus]|uniref:Uncharacterized protein n=1 Tax=Cherax quadricarinatus TaxID=27406 RepID=A0AAW0W319_CHEQU